MATPHRLASPTWARSSARFGTITGLRPRSGWREVELPLVEQDGLQLLLQHARNVLTGTALIAAGLGGLRRYVGAAPAAAGDLHLACLVAMAIGALLLVVNLCSGWRELARRSGSWAVRMGAVLAYAALSVLLTQAMVQLRGVL